MRIVLVERGLLWCRVIDGVEPYDAPVNLPDTNDATTGEAVDVARCVDQGAGVPVIVGWTPDPVTTTTPMQGEHFMWSASGRHERLTVTTGDHVAQVVEFPPDTTHALFLERVDGVVPTMAVAVLDGPYREPESTHR